MTLIERLRDYAMTESCMGVSELLDKAADTIAGLQEEYATLKGLYEAKFPLHERRKYATSHAGELETIADLAAHSFWPNCQCYECRAIFVMNQLASAARSFDAACSADCDGPERDTLRRLLAGAAQTKETCSCPQEGLIVNDDGEAECPKCKKLWTASPYGIYPKMIHDYAGNKVRQAEKGERSSGLDAMMYDEE